LQLILRSQTDRASEFSETQSSDTSRRARVQYRDAYWNFRSRTWKTILPLRQITKKLEGVTYNLYTKPCSCCEKLLYFLGRTDGARITCFQISKERSENVEEVIDEIHESFAIDTKGLINCLETTIDEITSKDDLPHFVAHDLSNYRIRTLDRARLILNRFSAEGKLEYLVANADSIDDDLVAAFTLGYLASENWWTISHEDAVFEGYRQREAREAGRPRAVDARLRIGRRSRQAVVNAARRLYEQESRLRRNDSKLLP
jgi:hypothetical protein